MSSTQDKTETDIQREIMVEASRRGIRLFRNNTGFFRTLDGRGITTGLCVGSSDLIGWTPHTITQEDVGKQIAVFTALEVKTERGKTTKEQDAFLDLVRRAGGIAQIIRHHHALKEILK